MIKHSLGLVAASLLSLSVVVGPVMADNQMGYRLLSADQAQALPHNGGKLGMQVDRAQQITSGDMTFDLLRVKGISPGSAGAKAGFKIGDEIIAVDGQVFPSVATFAAYVGSLPPAQDISVDYMPSGGGPQQAQRVEVTLGGAMAMTTPATPVKPKPAGLSTGTKVAIGVGAAALFGCYKIGCFSHKNRAVVQPAQ